MLHLVSHPESSDAGRKPIGPATLLFCLLFLPGTGFSSTGATPEFSVPASYPLSTEELVAEALANNLELRSYEAELAAARGERRQAGMWKNPELEGTYAYRRVSDPQEILVGEGVSRGLAIVQTFEFPGKGSLRKAMADQNIRLAELGVQQFRQALAGQIRSLSIQWVLLSENAQATAELSERSQALLHLLEARPIAGPVKLLEFRAIQGSLTELHFTARDLRQRQEEIRIQLNSLLGRPPQQEFRMREEIGTPAFPIGDIPAFMATGEGNNLQLRMRNLEVERAAKALNAAELEMAPDFKVGPYFSQETAGEDAINVGGVLAMTLPLWDWNQGGIDTARARQEKAHWLKQDAARQVRMTIYQRIRAYTLAREHLEATPKRDIILLDQSAGLADRQYRTGGAGIQLLLEVQRQYLAALRTRNESLLEAWQSWLDLDLLTAGACLPVRQAQPSLPAKSTVP